MRRGLLDAVKTAFREAGVRWRRLHVEDGGDELLVLVPAKVGKAVFVERVPRVLADRLRAYNAQHRGQARMRLRAAVHAGESSSTTARRPHRRSSRRVACSTPPS